MEPGYQCRYPPRKKRNNINKNNFKMGQVTYLSYLMDFPCSTDGTPIPEQFWARRMALDTVLCPTFADMTLAPTHHLGTNNLIPSSSGRIENRMVLSMIDKLQKKIHIYRPKNHMGNLHAKIFSWGGIASKRSLECFHGQAGGPSNCRVWDSKVG